MPVQIGQKPAHDFAQPLGLLSDCHRRIERFLAVIAKVAADARGGPLNGDQRQALGTALQYFREAAPRHTADEEESLFPRLRAAGGDDEALGELERLEADHDQADRLHAEADRLGMDWLRDGVLPSGPASRLCEIAGEMTALYAAHIEFEDARLFPMAGRVLPLDIQREIGREMAARRFQR